MRPSSALAFHARFPDEASCLAYLEKVRWQGTPSCPRCDNGKVYRIQTRSCLKCASCRRTFTTRHGTIFEDSKLPLRTWFHAIHAVTTTRPGVSSVELAEKLGTTQKTAWFVLQRIQYAVSHASFQKPLSGHVEMDDAEVSRNGEGKRAHVVAMAERGGEARMQVVETVDRHTVHGLATMHITPESRVSTDAAAGYERLKDEGFAHDTVNHGREYAKGETHTNTVEGLFGNFQRRLKGVHINVSAKHLQKYCDMYGHRYNHRQETPVERFEAWFAYCVKRLTYRDLVG